MIDPTIDEFFDLATLDLATPYINPTEHSGRRTMARNQCGWLWTAFVPDDDQSQIRILYSVDNAETWIHDQDVAIPLGPNAFSLQIALDEDEVPTVFWQCGTGTSFAWFFSSKSEDDGTWSAAYAMAVDPNSGPADNFTGSWAFDDEGYIHGFWIGFDIFEDGKTPPATNLFYTNNESGSFVTTRCMDLSEGLGNESGISNDICACPALAIDRCGNLHVTWLFSTRLVQTSASGGGGVDGWITFPNVTMSKTARYYFLKKKDETFVINTMPKQQALKLLYSQNPVNDVSRTYDQLTDKFRGSICCDEEFLAHLAYHWPATAPPFPTYNLLYYNKVTTHVLPYPVYEVSLLGSGSNYSQNASVSVSANANDLDTGSIPGGNRTAWVVFEGANLDVPNGFAMVNPSIINILYFEVSVETGIDLVFNLTDNAEFTFAPNTLSCLNPYFVVAAGECDKKFVGLFLQNDPAPLTTAKLRYFHRNGYAFQVSPYVPFDLMPCCNDDEQLVTFQFPGTSITLASYPYAPDFPLEVTESFGVNEVETEATDKITSPTTSTYKRKVKVTHKAIDKTTYDAILAFLDSVGPVTGSFTLVIPIGTGSEVNLYGYVLSKSILKARLAPSVYAIGFEFTESVE